MCGYCCVLVVGVVIQLISQTDAGCAGDLVGGGSSSVDHRVCLSVMWIVITLCALSRLCRGRLWIIRLVWLPSSV